MKIAIRYAVIAASLLLAQRSDAQKAGSTWLGLNRVHVQEYGFFKQYENDTCNCGEQTPLEDRSNAAVGLSIMRLYKMWGFSGDLGMAYGRVGRRNMPLESVPKQWLATLRTDLYLYPVMTRFAIKPYLFTSLHLNGNNRRWYASVPVGVGVRYQRENVAISLQSGISMFTDAASSRNAITSLGLYVPISRRKAAPAPKLIKDTDGDGLVDEMDKCPELAGDIANLGCPLYAKKAEDNDRDKDGVVDAKDKCPDTYGELSNSGCPATDRDGDGVFDHLDVCPDVKGAVSNGGCPLPEIAKPNSYEVVGNVYFAVDKYELRPAAKDTLNKALSILKANPGSVVELVGHTDSDGNHDYNLRLSKNRAEAARMYLINHGINHDRILTSFYGKDRPAVENSGATNKQRNRRVEIRLLDKGK